MTVALTLSACGGDECPSAVQLAIVDVEPWQHERLERQYRPEGSDRLTEAFLPLDPGTPVPLDEYRLAIGTVTIAAEGRRASRPGGFVLGLIGEAHATDCSFPGEAAQRLTGLTLRSDAAFSDALPAGAPLGGVSRVHGATDTAFDVSSGTRRFSGAPDAPAPDGTRPTLTELGARRDRSPLTLGFQIDVDTDDAREHRFTITWSVGSGETFELTTGPVLLTPRERQEHTP